MSKRCCLVSGSKPGGGGRHEKNTIFYMLPYDSHVAKPRQQWATMGIRLKVKVTLVQALRLCTGRTAHRGSRGIALPFDDHCTRKGWGVSVTPRPLFTPQERPGTHYTGGWVGPKAGLDRCGESRHRQDSIPGPSSPQPVAIPTTLPGPRVTMGVIN